MSTRKASRLLGAAIASMGLASASFAAAQDPHAAQPAPPIATPDAPLGEETAAPIGEAELGAISAGEGVVVEALSNQQLTASNSGSVDANQVVNGNVEFSAGAYSGIGNFVVNTGNNNNLQGVISVNIATLGGP